jgi:hypothetical protein
MLCSQRVLALFLKHTHLTIPSQYAFHPSANIGGPQISSANQKSANDRPQTGHFADCGFVDLRLADPRFRRT